jgi:hypothetical protein
MASMDFFIVPVVGLKVLFVMSFRNARYSTPFIKRSALDFLAHVQHLVAASVVHVSGREVPQALV